MFGIRVALVFGAMVAGGAFSPSVHAYYPDEELNSRSWSDLMEQLAVEHPEVPQRAVHYAFAYLTNHDQLVTNQDYLTIIDFDQPSTAERMLVIDLRTGHVTSYLVAHGKNSGENYADRFSNAPNSNMSSLGIYLTGEDYMGSHGLSLRLRGMEATNSNAEARDIVMHPADYVSYAFIRQQGRLGRSWGCPAVSPEVSEDLVRKLRNGSVFYIYHSSNS